MNRFTICTENVWKFATCDFATTFGTATFESPRISPYEVSYREKKKLEIREFPTRATFSFWQFNFRTEVCAGSCHTSDAMSWIRETESAQNTDDLKTCHPIPVKHFPNFETLNANTATALKKILALTVKFGWSSNNVNVHPVPLKARSPEKLMT